jgi:hypothetical protein
MMEAQAVFETFDYNSILKRMSPLEDFTEFSRRVSFKFYKISKLFSYFISLVTNILHTSFSIVLVLFFPHRNRYFIVIYNNGQNCSFTWFTI